MPRRSQLAERLKQPGIVVVPGCHDALAAKVYAKAGFEAVYMTGNGLSASLLGAPDIGLLTMSEMVARARAISAAIEVPLIADADTGYGNVNNVARTIAEFEAAGAAAIHLEDQVTPKKCGAMAGLELIAKEEHAEKIAAAVRARTHKDFLIIGRSDARLPLGLAAAIDRGRAYAAAGADLVLLEMLQSEDEMREALRKIDAPLMFNYVEKRVPALTARQFETLGFRIVCYPISSTLTYAKMLTRFAAALKEAGTTLGLHDDMLDIHEYEQLLDRSRYA